MCPCHPSGLPRLAGTCVIKKDLLRLTKEGLQTGEAASQGENEGVPVPPGADTVDKFPRRRGEAILGTVHIR